MKNSLTISSGEELIAIGKIISETASGWASLAVFPSGMAKDEIDIGFCDLGDDGFESETSIYSFHDSDNDLTTDDEDSDTDNNNIEDQDEEIVVLINGEDTYLQEVPVGIETSFAISLSGQLSGVIYYASIPEWCEFADNSEGKATLKCTFLEERSSPATIIAKSSSGEFFADVMLNGMDTEISGTYARIEGSDVTSGSNFGSALSISGKFVAVGDVNDSNLGAVYVYNYDGTIWNEVAKLTSDSPSSNDLFSDSIAIGSNGDSATCVVTATKSFGDSLYVFVGLQSGARLEIRLLDSVKILR